jgi:hypothetical protein
MRWDWMGSRSDRSVQDVRRERAGEVAREDSGRYEEEGSRWGGSGQVVGREWVGCGTGEGRRWEGIG